MDFFNDNDGNDDNIEINNNDGIEIQNHSSNNLGMDNMQFNDNAGNSGSSKNLGFGVQNSGMDFMQGTEMGLHSMSMETGMGMNMGMEEDVEETKRRNQRLEEETTKRELLTKKMNDEITQKEEFKNKAFEWVNNWRSLNEKNLKSKRDFNQANETDFLNNRQLTKDGKKNPWDIVIGNIDLRESDYKGSKDISRMRNVIVTRKGDFNNLKMK